MTACLEMVNFRLAEGVDREEFVKAAPAVTDWAARQPGFQYRALVDRGDEGWVDLVWWANEDAAKAAAERVMAEMADSPFMAMIDPASMKMAHHQVAHMGMGG